MTSLVLGKNVKSIGKDTFAKCTNLTSISLPDSLETLNDGVTLGTEIFHSTALSE